MKSVELSEKMLYNKSIFYPVNKMQTIIVEERKIYRACAELITM